MRTKDTTDYSYETKCKRCGAYNWFFVGTRKISAVHVQFTKTFIMGSSKQFLKVISQSDTAHRKRKVAVDQLKHVCADNPKLIGIFFISKYMVKKYGFEEAVRRTAKRKKK